MPADTTVSWGRFVLHQTALYKKNAANPHNRFMAKVVLSNIKCNLCTFKLIKVMINANKI